MFSYLLKIEQYIVIILTAIILFFFFTGKSLSKTNSFFVDNVEISEIVDLNFKRDKAINKSFRIAFNRLMKKILLSSDFNKINKIKINDIKKLIHSFEIKDEEFKDGKYLATYKIYFNNKSLNYFLGEKKLIYANPKNISLVFYPIFIIDNEVKLFDENIFYTNWQKVKVDNYQIDYILPVENIDDIIFFRNIIKNDELKNIANITKKYNTKNFIFATISKNKNNEIKIFLKMKFENSTFNKYYLYKNILLSENQSVTKIIKELKINILDLWKEQNVVNFDFPLKINLKFNYKNIKKLKVLQKKMNNIQIIKNHSIEGIDLNNADIRIEYFGNPKKLKKEFSKIGYLLEFIENSWVVHKI